MQDRAARDLLRPVSVSRGLMQKRPNLAPDLPPRYDLGRHPLWISLRPNAGERWKVQYSILLSGSLRSQQYGPWLD